MNRLSQLDALRAFAVLGVLFQHGTGYEHLPLGRYGVRLFFVLSGFLITGILLRARTKTNDRGQVLRAFYARRCLRIFPIYYLSLAVLWALGQSEIRETLPWHVLYGSNILAALPAVEIKPIWGHFWSLSVEEQFYLFWPVLVLFVPRKLVPATFLAAVLTGPIFRSITCEVWHYRPAFLLTPGCLDSLGLGALLAWLSENRRLDALRCKACRFAGAIGLAAIALTTVLGYLDAGWRVRTVTTDLGAALLSVWLVNGAVERFPGCIGHVLEWRGLTFIGAISYAIYLFHNFVPFLGETFDLPLPAHGLLRFVVLTLVTVPLAAASWYCIESPLNGLKDRFPYHADEIVSRSGSPEPDAQSV